VISVLMLAYGEEAHLGAAVAAVLASTLDLELVLIDNGCTSDAIANLPPDKRLRLETPDRNLGFTGGVNLAADLARGDVLVLVNSDAVVAPDAIGLLAERVADPAVGIAGACIRLADTPETVNSAGNPLHVLGLSWAGSMGRPATDVAGVREVASVSGACLAVRRDTWEALGGFPTPFFAYLEDLELAWRCWQRGLRVELVPQAVVAHHYEFGRSPQKMYLLERNRLLVLLTCHQARTLALLAVPLLAFEAAIALVAALQGWGGQKARGWRWIVHHRRWVRSRRREVQAARTVPDRELLRLLTSRFDPAQTPLPRAAAPLEWVLRVYWSVARRLV
jgi:GT2 family glycosyltransferase